MDLARVRSVIKRIPGAQWARRLLQAHGDPQPTLLDAATPGDFYSPIPDIDYVREHSDRIFARDMTSCPGIRLGAEEQTTLVRDLASYYAEMPFPESKQDGLRYYFQNPYFGHGSSIMLYSLMRHFRPKRIVEVGSGFSSAAMLDVSDRFFDGSIKFTFIEPYPERLYSLLEDMDADRHRVYVDGVQQVPRTAYAELEANDIVFIDSSHVAKVGSDVVFLLSEILPSLPKGVIIHFHDIYWPFEYPEDWVLLGRAWNEAYMIKAFLQFNSAFEILLFNSYLATHQKDVVEQCLPLFLPEGGSSLWIRKTQ